MKILHTADLHLGLRTEGKDRLFEQKRILNEINQIADQNEVDIVLVAGDVFQYSIPSADAEDLFFEFVDKISNSNRRAVVVIAGNHDDPKRLAAGSYLAEKHNIILASDLSKQRKIVPHGEVQIVDQGRGFVKLKKGNETAVVAFLPYPIESKIEKSVEDLFDDESKKKFANESYAEKVQRWSEIGAAGFEKNSFNIFMTHIFAVGGKMEVRNNVETIKLGDVLAVPISVLPKAHYIALGHLHMRQCVDEKRKVFYSGSPLEVRFFDSKPEVIVFEGDQTGVKEVKTFQIESAVKMDQIEATSVEDAKTKLLQFESDDIVELTIRQTEPLKASEIKELKASFDCLTQVRLALEVENSFESESVIKRKELNSKDLFSKFYQAKKGIEPSEELLNLFVSLMEDKSEAN